MKKIISFIFTSLLVANVFCQKVIECEGIGNSEELARTSALQQMSQLFSSKVQTSTEATKLATQSTGKETKTSSISTISMKTLVTSDMPLYGVKFKTSNNGKKGKELEYTVVATLEPSISIPTYKTKISEIVKKIDTRYKGLSKLSADKEDAEWKSLLSDYATFEKLEMVMRILGNENKDFPQISSSDFRIKYEQRASSITTLEKAGEMIANAVSSLAKSIYVYPALLDGDNTATDFSNAIANAVKTNLGKKVALSKLTANAYLQGSYYFSEGNVNGDDVVVTYYLCSSDGSVLGSSGMIKIPYKVYSQYRAIPRNYDLYSEIVAGRVANPEFDVSIRINGERNGLSFRNGDSLKIEARTTSTCYIYVLCHAYNDEGEPFTYLFPLEPYADGKEMFIKKIPAKDVNKWVVLNPVIDNEVMNIEVMPPFGEEMLQIFATTTDNFDDVLAKIPQYIETDDFYLVSGKPVSNVSKSRALAVKKAASKAAKVVNNAENFVTYTTHK